MPRHLTLNVLFWNATAQLIRQKQDTPTRMQSATLVRNLIRTAISSVCYLRNIFDEDCFKDRPIAGINIKSLLGTKSNEAKLLCQWLEEGVFDALEKHYLHEMHFGIATGPKENDKLIENYTFTFTYEKENIITGIKHKIEGDSCNEIILHSKERIKGATVSLLRNLISLGSTLKPIPKDRHLLMTITYYDDRTPIDYSPPFFKATLIDDILTFKSKSIRMDVGTVETPFHKMNLNIGTTLDQFEDENSLSENSYTDDETECPSMEEYLRLIIDLIKDDPDIGLSDLVDQFPNVSRANINLALTNALNEMNKIHSEDVVDDLIEYEKAYEKVVKFCRLHDYVNNQIIHKHCNISLTLASQIIENMTKAGLLGKPKNNDNNNTKGQKVHRRNVNKRVSKERKRRSTKSKKKKKKKKRKRASVARE